MTDLPLPEASGPDPLPPDALLNAKKTSDIDLASLSREELEARLRAFQPGGWNGSTDQQALDSQASRKKRRRSGDDDKTFTVDELRALFGAVRAAGKPRDVAIFTVALHRGLRASEVGLLRMEDLRIKDRRLYVTRVKGSSSQDYVIHDEEIIALRAWLRLRGTAGGALFLSRNHRPISRYRLDDLIKRYGRAAGIAQEKCHFHRLRHMCGFTLREMGERLEDIQDHLGHRDIRNTQRYAKMSPRQRAQMGERNKGWKV